VTLAKLSVPRCTTPFPVLNFLFLPPREPCALTGFLSLPQRVRMFSYCLFACSSSLPPPYIRDFSFYEFMWRMFHFMSHPCLILRAPYPPSSFFPLPPFIGLRIACRSSITALFVFFPGSRPPPFPPHFRFSHFARLSLVMPNLSCLNNIFLVCASGRGRLVF